MSFLSTSIDTHVSTPIPSHITREQVLSFLHSPEKVILLNPNRKSHEQLPAPRATAFFASETQALKPASPENVTVLEITEGVGADRGWAKRFVPETISMETSMEPLEDGLRTITHAPLGVHSAVVWKVQEEGGKLMLVENGRLTSNRVLMSFIKADIQRDHDKLVADFMAALEKDVSGEKAT